MADDELAAIRATRLKELQQLRQQQQPHTAQVTAHSVCQTLLLTSEARKRC
jgi:DNA-binding TFAR19-related protein (PDSD5 family)